MSVVSFLIKIQDGLTAPLANITTKSASAKNSLQKLTESNKQLKSMMDGSGVSINALNTKIAKLKEYRDILPAGSEQKIRDVNTQINQLTKQLERMQNMNGSKLKTWFKEAFDGLPQLAKNPLVAIGAVMASGFNEGMKNSREKLDFSLLLGKEAGAKVFGGVKQMQRYYGQSANAGAKQLVNSGMDSAHVPDILERIGKVASGDEGKFGALTAAFAALQKEGKLTESTLESMENNGFKPLLILQKRFGQDASFWQKQLQEGKIDVDNVKKALLDVTDAGGLFADTLKQIDASPTGIWDRLFIGTKNFAGSVGELILPVITPVFGLLNFLIEKATSGMNWLKQTIEDNHEPLSILGAIIGGVAGMWAFYQTWVRAVWMWQMRDLVATSLLTTAKGLQATVVGGATAAWTGLTTAIMANPIGAILGAVVGVVAAIGLMAVKFEWARKIVYGVWEILKEIFTSAVGLIKQIFSPIGEGVEAIKNGDWKGLAKAAGKMMLNLTPVGVVGNTISYAQGGGFNNVIGAYGRGADRAHAEFEAQKANATHGFGEQTETDKLLKEYLQTNSLKDNKQDKLNQDINAVSGGGAKSYTINIGKIIEKWETRLLGNSQESVFEFERKVEEALVRILASLPR